MIVKNLCTPVKPVPIDIPANRVLDYFADAGGPSFLPVVDDTNHPLGIVREKDLKPFIYSFFGRELLTRRKLSEFLYSCPIIPDHATADDLLEIVATNNNPDGVIIIDENGHYWAVMFGSALLQLFGKHHQDMQVRIVQLQKMEAIGTLAGGIAHDLNNLLTPILGFTEMIRDAIDEGDAPDVSLLDDIHACAIRAAETVKRVQTFSRHQATERQVIYLHKVVEEAVRLLVSSSPKTISFIISHDIEDDTIMANSGELLQVIMNLCNNAVHAMKDKCGDIHLSISKHSGNLPGWHLCKNDLDGEYVHLSVKDQGCGIPEAVIPQVFVPFFTTKKQDEGTGMGLAVVHGIVSRAKGYISIESELDKGTTIHVVWPLHRVKRTHQNVRIPNHRQTTAEIEKSAPRAVVVDDEPAITRLAQATLSRRGYEVFPFTDSLAALHAIENEALWYDVLILDQMMPNMTGIELAKRALLIYPHTPVIMCSGYTDLVSPEEAKRIGIQEFLSKPVNFNDVAERIKTHLRSRAGTPASIPWAT